MAAPFLDTLDPAYDADIHAAHAVARARSWYATTPVGIIVLRYRDVAAVLHDRRWREQGPDALRAAGIDSGGRGSRPPCWPSPTTSTGCSPSAGAPRART